MTTTTTEWTTPAVEKALAAIEARYRAHLRGEHDLDAPTLCCRLCEEALADCACVICGGATEHELDERCANCLSDPGAW